EPVPATPSRGPVPAAPVAGGPPPPPRLSSVAPSTAPEPQPAEARATGPAAAAPGAPTGVSVAGPSAEESPAVAAGSSLDLGPVVLMWPAVLEALKASSRVAHTLAEGTAPMSRTSSAIVVAHPDRSRLDYLRTNKGHLELLRLAVLDVLHLDVEIDLVLDPSRAAAAPAAAAPATAPPAPVAPETGAESPRQRATAKVAEERAARTEPVDDVVSADDPDADGDLSGLALVQRELGGTVMTEYDNG
ncbi:MAG TPA: hypothetical protein VLV82_05910, partial [Candidatus Angelobacter sp.]|nr:hypothetical protein [Candidatus Angelobacter sp.]